MWVRVDPNGNTSNPHTGDPLTISPGSVLYAIKGHAGENPPSGVFVCIAEGKYVRLGPTSPTLEQSSLKILDGQGLYNTGRAVTNNGFAFFDSWGSVVLNYQFKDDPTLPPTAPE